MLSVIACNTKPKVNTNTTTTFKSKNTDSFNLAFDSVLSEYDQLRTAFINWDTAAANKSASALERLIIYVPYEQLKDDEKATKANSVAQNASAAAENIARLDSINDKRRMFYTLSESIYNLAKLTDYDKAVLYHKKCPMAFNGDQEGWWFSESKKIDNPYFGKFHPKYKNAMLECGSVEDSLNQMH
jgi:hypothetical protein